MSTNVDFSPIFVHSLSINFYLKKKHTINIVGKYRGVRIMVLNATFNNISVISRLSFLLVEEETGENHQLSASH